MKKLRFYIPIIHQRVRYSSLQLVSIKRMKSLQELIPSKIELLTHIKIEKKYSKEIKNYKPQPYIIRVTSSDFDSILKEIQIKIPKYNLNSISLLLTPKSKPLVKIISIEN